MKTQKICTTSTKISRFKRWAIALIVVLSYAALAGWYGKANAQETGDIVLIGDDVYTVIEIGPDSTILIGD